MRPRSRLRQARFYLTGGTIALLMAIWAGLSAHDAKGREQRTQAQVSPSPQATAASKPSPGLSSEATPTPIPRTHGRTRAS